MQWPEMACNLKPPFVKGNLFEIRDVKLTKFCLSLAKRGNWLFAGSMDGTVSLHNLQKNQNLLSMECGERVISVDFDEQISAAISNLADGTCQFWEIHMQ